LILILMDIELGGKIDGIETTYLIQQFSDIPILFLTANTSKEIMEKVRSITGYGYVVKRNGRACTYLYYRNGFLIV